MKVILLSKVVDRKRERQTETQLVQLKVEGIFLLRTCQKPRAYHLKHTSFPMKTYLSKLIHRGKEKISRDSSKSSNKSGKRQN